MQKYENIIAKIKKLIDGEKRSLRMVRTACSKDIEQRNALEKIMRACVDDVKAEISRKRGENKSIYSKF